MKWLLSASVALASLVAAACGNGTSHGGGGANASSSTGSGAGGSCASTPTFAEVLAKPLSGCSGFEPPCHNGSAGELHIDPMDAKVTYDALVNVKTFSKGSGVRVVPGDPASSFLYKKLVDDLGPNEGDPMPKASGLNPVGPGAGSGGPMWTELPKDQIEIVRCWIQGGAEKN